MTIFCSILHYLYNINYNDGRRYLNYGGYMRIKKLLLCLIAFFVVLLIPKNVYADLYCNYEAFSYEEAFNKVVNNDLFKKENGEYVLYLKTVPIANVYDDYYTYAEVQRNMLDYLLGENVFGENDIYYVDFDEDNKRIKIRIAFIDPNTNECIVNDEYFNFKYETPPDNDLIEEANTITNSLKNKEYKVEDLELLNLYWNYGNIEYRFDNYYDNTLIYSFQEIKNTVTKNKKFNYVTKSVYSGLSSFHGYGRTALLIVEKDGFAYSNGIINLYANFFFKVDKDKTGTQLEKTAERIKNYFGIHNGFYLEPVEYGDDIYQVGSNSYNVQQYRLYFTKDKDQVDAYWRQQCGWEWSADTDFCNHKPFVVTDNSYYFEGDNNTQSHNNETGDIGYSIDNPIYLINVANVSASEIDDKLIINSQDSDTDVEVSSESYDVPIDSVLDTKNQSNNKNFISLLNQYNYQMVDAYNINLYGKYTGNPVKTIENGIEVFIPTSKYKEGDVITIKHIKDDGTLGEELQGTVIKKGNKLYAKFTTTHFSTYALVEPIIFKSSTGSIDFGTLNTTATKSIEKQITLTNNGTKNLTVSVDIPTSDGPFGMLSIDGANVIAPGETKTITLIARNNSSFSTIVGDYTGTYKITATEEGTNEEYLAEVSATVKVREKNTSIEYTTHVQNIGWQKYVKDGAMAGTEGKAYRLEGIKIRLADQEYEGSIEYRTHIQNIGWESKFKKDDQMSGTEGLAYRLEAIEIKLTGAMAEHYDVYYRVHAENFGWLGWARNGERSGTAGYAYRLEGIEIKLVKKDVVFDQYGKGAIFWEKGVGATKPNQNNNTTPNPDPNPPAPQNKLVSYTTHVQNIGWQDYVYDGAMAGTSGKAFRLEGIKIRLVNPEYSGNIEYRTHIQNIGWESKFKKNDEMSGTEGKAYRLEAIEIKLTGEIADHYDVYYRVHAQNFGWLGWAKNGEQAGTAGYAYRLEGIEIVLVNKEATFIGTNSGKKCFYSK